PAQSPVSYLAAWYVGSQYDWRICRWSGDWVFCDASVRERRGALVLDYRPVRRLDDIFDVFRRDAGAVSAGAPGLGVRYHRGARGRIALDDRRGLGDRASAGHALASSSS